MENPVASAAVEAGSAGAADMSEDAHDKSKVSRWQIGSSSLSILEQVYAMEPFPGLATRNELSRKLNVSSRQVQVWFQNKRQRERKLSRGKGLLSTPGLPDTPAVMAAHAAKLAAADKQAGPMSTHAESCSTQFSSSVPLLSGAALHVGGDVAVSQAKSAPGISGDAGGDADVALSNTPSGPTDLVPSPAFSGSCRPLPKHALLGGLPMMRSVSLEGSGLGSVAMKPLNSSSLDGCGPTSFDDMEIPLGLSSTPIHRFGHIASLPTHSAPLLGPSAKALNEMSEIAAAHGSMHTEGRSACLSTSGSEAGGVRADGIGAEALPHLAGMHATMLSSEQANEATRLAVQSTRKLLEAQRGVNATGGFSQSASGLPLATNALALLQALLPRIGDNDTGSPQVAACSQALQSAHVPVSFPNTSGDGPRLSHEQSLPDTTALGACSNRNVNASSEITELSAHVPAMVHGSTTCPSTKCVTDDMGVVDAVTMSDGMSAPFVGYTPSTHDVMVHRQLVRDDRPRASDAREAFAATPGPQGPRAAARVDGLVGNSQKRGRWSDGGHINGLPMARSGVSNLLDDLDLDLDRVGSSDLSVAKGFGNQVAVGDRAAPSLLSGPTAPSAHSTCAWPATDCSLPAFDTLCAPELTPALTPAQRMKMQEDADRYVQVITSAQEPYQIVWASDAWLRLCEYTAPQVLGHTLEVIRGPCTCPKALGQLMASLRSGEPITLSMINHMRTGRPFAHTLRVEPLRDSRGDIQCFQATSSNIDESPLDGPAASTVTGNQVVSDADAAVHNPFDAALNGAVLGDNVQELLSDWSSEVQNAGTLPRSGSELQVSDMLDLFDQDANLRSASSSSPPHRCSPHVNASSE